MEVTDRLLPVLLEIRGLLRLATRPAVRAALAEALPDEKQRRAYQMFDGRTSVQEIRKACKMSPNAVVAVGTRCVALGLMEERGDKRRVRLFDLREYGLLSHGTFNGSVVE